MTDPERKSAFYTYDPDTGAAYIELAGPIPAGGVARTIPVHAMADFDADGNALGLEIHGLNPDGPTTVGEGGARANRLETNLRSPHGEAGTLPR